MNFKKNNREYLKTTDNRTYNICHFAAEGICCRACQKRHRQEWYVLKPKNSRYPSWKLVSKNKKQWMPKNLKYEREIFWTGEWWFTTITW